jgi:hypothetical protein
MSKKNLYQRQAGMVEAISYAATMYILPQVAEGGKRET